MAPQLTCTWCMHGIHGTLGAIKASGHACLGARATNTTKTGGCHEHTLGLGWGLCGVGVPLTAKSVTPSALAWLTGLAGLYVQLVLSL